MSLGEWRQAITTPTAYRMGNSTLRFQTKIILILLAFAIVALLYVSLPPQASAPLSPSYVGGKKGSILWGASKNVAMLNSIYPLSNPVQTEKGMKFRIGIISDLDQDSKSSGGKWISYLRRGSLFIRFDREMPKHSKVLVEWESGEPQVIKSGYNVDGRGMELSELMVFNGKLLSCDDRTGIIYHLLISDTEEILPVPWVVLADGNGTLPKGFKCEWGCIKDDDLMIGGLGKEWTTSSGELLNYNPQYVKKISMHGEVTHLDWRMNYQKMAHALNIRFPGYVIHESGGWSDTLKRWVFLPRRASTEQYHEKTDEKKGTNVILVANEDFSKIDVRHVGDVIPTHGFSSFKWIPGTDDQLIVALKSEEIEGKTATYLMVFDMDGNIIVPETKVGDHKYEGIEFL